MPHRDPQTGKFVSSAVDDADIEVATFATSLQIPASELNGETDGTLPEGANFEGILLYDMEDLVDRSEYGRLLHADHRLVAGITSTQTADGTLAVGVEVSASPSLAIGQNVPSAGALNEVEDQDGFGLANNDTGLKTGGVAFSDTLDLIGPPMSVVSYGPITDGATGVGGAGSAGEDRVAAAPPGFDMDPRDEVFLNGALEAENVADSSIIVKVAGQHIYEVRGD